MSNYDKTLIVDLYPFGDLRNGLRLLAKHRGDIKKIGVDDALKLPARGVMNNDPNNAAAFEAAAAGLRVTGQVRPGLDGDDKRVLFAVQWFECAGKAAKTQPALKAQLASLTTNDRLIILMHGSKPGDPPVFNRPRDLQEIATWLIDCGFRKAKKISLAVCWAGLAHPSWHGEAGIDDNSAVAFGMALLSKNAEDLQVEQIVARRGKVMIREDGTKYVEDDRNVSWVSGPDIYAKGKGKTGGRFVL